MTIRKQLFADVMWGDLESESKITSESFLPNHKYSNLKISLASELVRTACQFLPAQAAVWPEGESDDANVILVIR